MSFSIGPTGTIKINTSSESVTTQTKMLQGTTGTIGVMDPSTSTTVYLTRPIKVSFPGPVTNVTKGLGVYSYTIDGQVVSVTLYGSAGGVSVEGSITVEFIEPEQYAWQVKNPAGEILWAKKKPVTIACTNWAWVQDIEVERNSDGFITTFKQEGVFLADIGESYTLHVAPKEGYTCEDQFSTLEVPAISEIQRTDFNPTTITFNIEQSAYTTITFVNTAYNTTFISLSKVEYRKDGVLKTYNLPSSGSASLVVDRNSTITHTYDLVDGYEITNSSYLTKQLNVGSNETLEIPDASRSTSLIYAYRIYDNLRYSAPLIRDTSPTSYTIQNRADPSAFGDDESGFGYIDIRVYLGASATGTALGSHTWLPSSIGEEKTFELPTTHIGQQLTIAAYVTPYDSTVAEESTTTTAQAVRCYEVTVNNVLTAASFHQPLTELNASYTDDRGSVRSTLVGTNGQKIYSTGKITFAYSYDTGTYEAVSNTTQVFTPTTATSTFTLTSPVLRFVRPTLTANKYIITDSGTVTVTVTPNCNDTQFLMGQYYNNDRSVSGSYVNQKSFNATVTSTNNNVFTAYNSVNPERSSSLVCEVNDSLHETLRINYITSSQT